METVWVQVLFWGGLILLGVAVWAIGAFVSSKQTKDVLQKVAFLAQHAVSAVKAEVRDEDGDGKISGVELGNACKRVLLGMTSAEVKLLETMTRSPSGETGSPQDLIRGIVEGVAGPGPT